MPPICLLGKDHKLGSEISLSQAKKENTSSSIKLLCLQGKGSLTGSGQAQILGREQQMQSALQGRCDSTGKSNNALLRGGIAPAVLQTRWER